MTEHPDLQRLRDGYTAFGTGDLAALTELWRPDVVWHEPGRNEPAGTYRSPDAIVAMFARTMELTEWSFRAEPLLRCAADAHGTALVRLTGQRGGHSLDVLCAHVMRIEAGLTAEFWDAPTDREAMDAFFGRPVSEAAPAPRP